LKSAQIIKNYRKKLDHFLANFFYDFFDFYLYQKLTAIGCGLYWLLVSKKIKIPEEDSYRVFKIK
jgi:hypothetical protein